MGTIGHERNQHRIKQMKEELTKQYTHGQLTVVWKSKKCIHSEVCITSLPEIYKPKEKPWIRPKNVTISALKSQIDTCASGE